MAEMYYPTFSHRFSANYSGGVAWRQVKGGGSSCGRGFIAAVTEQLGARVPLLSSDSEWLRYVSVFRRATDGALPLM